MKLQLFDSAEGDCLLLQSADGRNILCDGGRSSSFRRHTREHFDELLGSGGQLDYLYVSHVDQDHIQGIEQLLKDALAWQVYDYHHDNGDSVRKPEAPRPPPIGGIWHNSFGDQVGDNLGEISDLLAQSVPVMFASGLPDLEHAAYEARNIAASIPQALRVSRFCQPDLLDIPINVLPDNPCASPLLYTDGTVRKFSVGSLELTLLGPTEKALDDLREGWNNWLASSGGEKAVKKFHDYIEKQLARFATGSLSTTPFDLFNWNGIPDFRGVTTPNVASLMFMIEEDGKRVLFTGDSQQDVILDALAEAGYLDDGFIHVDVLKVPHHGSEHNMDKNFARRVSADHYVFCGDGSNGNPEPSVIDILYKSRIGPVSRRAMAPEADNRDFTFWFSTALDKLNPQSVNHEKFKKTLSKSLQRQTESGSLLQLKFVDGDYLTIAV